VYQVLVCDILIAIDIDDVDYLIVGIAINNVACVQQDVLYALPEDHLSWV
jgi:hypothetical protein